jgi:hypothetical protein
VARRKTALKEATQKVSDGKEHVKAKTDQLKDKATGLGHRAEQAVPEQVREAVETAVDKAGISRKRSPRRRRIWSGVAGSIAVILVARNRRKK